MNIFHPSVSEILWLLVSLMKCDPITSGHLRHINPGEKWVVQDTRRLHISALRSRHIPPGKFQTHPGVQTSSTCCWCLALSHRTLQCEWHHLQLGVQTSWSSLLHQDLRDERNIFREHQRQTKYTKYPKIQAGGSRFNKKQTKSSFTFCFSKAASQLSQDSGSSLSH